MPEPEGDKVFTQRWPISLWLRCKAQAESEGMSLNAWMQQAAEEKLEDRCCDGSTLEETIAAPKPA